MRTAPNFLLPVFAIAAAFFELSPRAHALDFDKDIEPILRKKCFKCHSGPRAKAGLRMDNLLYLAKKIGTEEDMPIHPGHPEKSLLVKKASLPRTDTDAMPPPRRGEGLSAIELGAIKTWITEGASLESKAAEPGDKPTTEKPAADMNKVYAWSNTDGKKLQAGFVRLEGTNVVLKKEDGTEFSYPMSSLSADSRKQAKDLSIAQ
ncbi:MAG: c-type cytochrome domain-containing protein [Verrucomicrobiales bacterium]|nr:hypothetical protein [Verrucomicrobiales bacterium]MDC0314529.1 hypothetical protein [bacterium]